MQGLLRRLGLRLKLLSSKLHAPAQAPEPTPEPPSNPEPGLPFDMDELIKAMITAVQELNLRKEKAYPLLYLDRSGSTEEGDNHLYTDGTMQLLTSLVAATALGGFSATSQKAAPLRFFSNSVIRPMWPDDGMIRRDNVNQILDRNRGLRFGGTYFIPPLMDMVRQALLVNARANIQSEIYLNGRVKAIEAMTDADLLDFIRPQIDADGKELLKPLLQLPHPICAFMGTDGMSVESLERLLEILRWMSQLGIYIMLVGVGHHDFAVLKGMDQAGEMLFLKKGLKPLWDNVDFMDLKDITGDANLLPDGPTVVILLVGKFMSTAYRSCREHHLIA